MKLYNALVRLSGSLNNEVLVSQITASEIAVLQRIHGDDAVQKIAEVGSVRGRSDARERARLTAVYPKGPSADGKMPLEGAAFLNSIFGVGTPLPAVYEAPLVEEVDDEVIEKVEDKEEIELAEKPTPIKRTKLPPKKAEPVDLVA